MFKLIKDKGVTTNLTIINTDTNTSTNLGTIKMPILNILHAGGYDTPSMTDEWDLSITYDIASELIKTTMPIKKPTRDQSKTKSEQPADIKTKKQPVDVFNLIFGTE